MATTISKKNKEMTLLQAIDMVSQNDRLCCSVSVWRKDLDGWTMMIWHRIWT